MLMSQFPLKDYFTLAWLSSFFNAFFFLNAGLAHFQKLH